MGKLPFTKGEVMIELYSIADHDLSKERDVGSFTYVSSKLKITIWYKTPWVEISVIGSRKSYLLYNDKLFDGYCTGPYNYTDFIDINKFFGTFKIKGKKTPGFVDSNGWVRWGDGRFLTKLKQIKEW
jgi:hypothetical protein